MSIGDYSGGRAGIYIMHELSATWTHLTIHLVTVSFGYCGVDVGMDAGFSANLE